MANLTNEEIATRLEELHCTWHDSDQTQLDGTDPTVVDGVVALLEELRADTCVLVVPGATYTIQRSTYGTRALFITSDANDVNGSANMDDGGDEGQPPRPSTPPPAA